MSTIIYSQKLYSKVLACINIILIGHHSQPVSGINGELPVEYDYPVPPPHVHVHMSSDAVNQSERAEGSNIPLSANESYSATTRF